MLMVYISNQINYKNQILIAWEQWYTLLFLINYQQILRDLQLKEIQINNLDTTIIFYVLKILTINNGWNYPHILLSKQCQIFIKTT